MPTGIDLYGLQSVMSVSNSFFHGTGSKFQKENPKTAAAIAAVPILITGGGIAVGTYGAEAVGGFIINEVKDEALSQATGGVSDIIDITKAGTKLLKSGLDAIKGLDKLDDVGLAAIKGGSLFRKGKVGEFRLGHPIEDIEESHTYIYDVKTLTDEELIKSFEPGSSKWGTITVKRGVIYRGNNRIYEAERRGLDIEFEYENLPDDNSDYFFDYEN